MEVYAPEASSAVIIGDSTLANDIPILLAEKLRNAGITNVGVLQQAIKGNRLLDDGAGFLGMAYGEAMVDRFARDALDQPGVEKIFLKVGVNDVVHPNCESLKGEARPVTAQEMIDGYKQLIQEAHGQEALKCTFSPELPGRATPEMCRAAVQMWNGRLRSTRCARILTHGSAARTTRRTAA